jgi:hypothetical protein
MDGNWPDKKAKSAAAGVCAADEKRVGMCVASLPMRMCVWAALLPRIMSKTDTSQIAEDILRYLAKHPRAQDTIEGIYEWWLLEEDIIRRLAEVKAALAALVGDGLIIESRTKDARTFYRLNKRRYRQIQARLKENGSERAEGG